jgi:hypothetical protein
MQFGRYEEKRTPISAKFGLGAGNRRRKADWDRRGVEAQIADGAAEAGWGADGSAPGGSTRSGPRRLTRAEKELIRKAKAKEAELEAARKRGLPKARVKAIERAAKAAVNNANRRVPRGSGRGRAW